jgi:hypothetical protein
MCLHLVVVDGYARSWFIEDSSLAGRVGVGRGSVYFTPSSGFPSPAPLRTGPGDGGFAALARRVWASTAHRSPLL